jgi:hypothetical protein
MISLFSAIPVVSEQVLRPNRCPSRPCRDAALARVNRLTIRSTIITNLADNEYTPLNCTGATYATPPASGDQIYSGPLGTID